MVNGWNSSTRSTKAISRANTTVLMISTVSPAADFGASAGLGPLILRVSLPDQTRGLVSLVTVAAPSMGRS